MKCLRVGDFCYQKAIGSGRKWKLIWIYDVTKPVTISIGEDVYVLGGLGNWVTFQQYVEMFNLKSINTIYNWVARGIVSDHHCVEIPNLNTKLIKAQAYNKKKAGRPKKSS